MRVLDPGHRYLLNIYDGEGMQPLRFMKREGEKFPGNIGHYSGTNCQEVLRALIDRVKYLDNQVPCLENDRILECLREVLFQFESRAARRHKRDFPTKYRRIEEQPHCRKCGHIGCECT